LGSQALLEVSASPELQNPKTSWVASSGFHRLMAIKIVKIIKSQTFACRFQSLKLPCHIQNHLALGFRFGFCFPTLSNPGSMLHKKIQPA